MNKSSDSVAAAKSLQAQHSAASPVQEVAKDASFWGINLAQFFTVFNDNFYKQIVLFLCVAAAAAANSKSSEGLQGFATIVFSLPFLLLSGFCGFLSDRYSKRLIIITAKVAEVLIMALGIYGFYSQNLTLLFVLLFLMGVHSALFGPAKYGILPELFPSRLLPTVNGMFQLSMFMSIIAGLACSGKAKEYLTQGVEAGGEDHLWYAGVICTVLGTLGLICTFMIRSTPVAKPELRFQPSDLILNKETFKVLLQNRQLLVALLATSVFWATGGLVYPQAINEVVLRKMGLSEAIAGYMAAGTGLGIAIGCVTGMIFSRGRFNARLVRIGCLGMFAGLILLSIPGKDPKSTFLGVYGMAAVLVWIGISAGLYSVPLQVFIQANAPVEHKGRVIGAMNLSNWIGIFLSGGLFIVVNGRIDVEYKTLLFGIGAIFLLPIILFYHPKSQNLEAETPAVSEHGA